MKQKAVAIVSGGIDSVTMLYKLINEGNYEVYALSFIYGQRHKSEVKLAEYHCAELGVPHKLVELPIQDILKSALTTASIPVPEVPETAEHYETLKTTVVPNRNAIFISIATGYAGSIGAKRVFYAAHYSDRGVYPDCRVEFVSALSEAMALSLDDREFRVRAPFVEMTKGQIVKIGAELGIDYSKTWSCYKGLAVHCGKCSSCFERKRAFEEAGVNDPTSYGGE